jgi:hypothetical protein
MAPRGIPQQCSSCGKAFMGSDAITFPILCITCKSIEDEAKKLLPHLSSDGGYGPRTHYGHKKGGPFTFPDEDANKFKDED